VAEKDCQRMRTAQGGSDAPRSVCLSWHFALATVPKVTRWTEAQRARILAARFDYGPLAATRQSQPTPAPNKAVRDGRTKRRGRGCCTLCARVGVVQAQTPRAPPADSHAHPSATGRQRSLQRDGTKVSAQRSAAERSGAQRSAADTARRQAALGTQPLHSRLTKGHDAPFDLYGAPRGRAGRPQEPLSARRGIEALSRQGRRQKGRAGLKLELEQAIGVVGVYLRDVLASAPQQYRAIGGARRGRTGDRLPPLLGIGGHHRTHLVAPEEASPFSLWKRKRWKKNSGGGHGKHLRVPPRPFHFFYCQ